MTGALPYLVLTRLKNWCKEFIRRPSRIILALFFVAMLAVVLWSTTLQAPGEFQPILPQTALYAIIFALFAFVSIFTVFNGIDKGATFFKMPDVNFLFTAPLSPIRVLNYGLLSQLTTTAMGAFFLIWQYSWLHNVFGFTFPMLLVVLVGYVLAIFISQITALALYCYGGGDEKRKMRVKALVLAWIALCLLVVVVLLLLAPGSLLERLIAVGSSPALYLLPIFGWISAAVVGLLTGSYLFVALGLLASALLVFFMVKLIQHNGADFYEDVLTATESSFLTMLSAKEGRVSEKGKVKKGEGLKGGHGASVFFYKHMLENKRSGQLFLSMTSLIFGAVTIGFAYVTMQEAGGELYTVISIVSFGAFMQIFGSLKGRWLKEFLSPFLFLVPESAFKKLFWILQENMLKLAVDSIVFGIPIGLICGLNPLGILGMVLVRFAIGVLVVAANIVVEMLFGSLHIKWMVMILYFVGVFVLAVPGVVLAVVLALAAPAGLVVFAALSGFSIATLLLSLLMIFLCRNVLNNAEMLTT